MAETININTDAVVVRARGVPSHNHSSNAIGMDFMGHALQRKEVKQWLTRLCAKIDKEECYSCDCFQGFVMQLRLDAEEGMDDLFQALEVSTDRMHSCLGCDPCPPGEVYSAYILDQEGNGT